MSALIAMLLLVALALGLAMAWRQAVLEKKLACARLEQKLEELRAENRRLKARISTSAFT